MTLAWFSSVPSFANLPWAFVSTVPGKRRAGAGKERESTSQDWETLPK